MNLFRRLLACAPASPGDVREDPELIATDDRMLSVLGGRDLDEVAAVAADPLARLLFAWRADVDSTPMRGA
jgi:hypothetical protein